MTKKPGKYLIWMKTNKGKKVNTQGIKRPKYSLKKLQLFANSNGKLVILSKRPKYPTSF